jgi:hypothetical protein
MPRQHITVSAEHTPASRGAELIRLEIEAPVSVLQSSHGLWTTAGRVATMNRPRLRGKVLPGEVESALEWLSAKGLVELRISDELADKGLQQGYRWHARSTPEVLRHWSQRLAERLRVCGWCKAPLPETVQRMVYCDSRCRRAWNNAQASRVKGGAA